MADTSTRIPVMLSLETSDGPTTVDAHLTLTIPSLGVSHGFDMEWDGNQVIADGSAVSLADPSLYSSNYPLSTLSSADGSRLSLIPGMYVMKLFWNGTCTAAGQFVLQWRGASGLVPHSALALTAALGDSRLESPSAFFPLAVTEDVWFDVSSSSGFAGSVTFLQLQGARVG